MVNMVNKIVVTYGLSMTLTFRPRGSIVYLVITVAFTFQYFWSNSHQTLEMNPIPFLISNYTHT